MSVAFGTLSVACGFGHIYGLSFTNLETDLHHSLKQNSFTNLQSWHVLYVLVYRTLPPSKHESGTWPGPNTLNSTKP